METLNYGKIIKAARESRKMTQTVLGGKIGVGKTAICNYESSQNVPPRNMFAKIAEALSYSPDEMIALFSQTPSPSVVIPHEPQSPTPTLIPYDRFGNTDFFINNLDKYKYYSFSFPEDVMPHNGQYVCFKANDSSMQLDGINKNDYLFVNLTDNIPEKSIVLFRNKLSKNYYIRRYFRDGHIVSMMPSVNETRFEPIRYDDRDNDYEIIGVVEKILTNIK